MMSTGTSDLPHDPSALTAELRLERVDLSHDVPSAAPSDAEVDTSTGASESVQSSGAAADDGKKVARSAGALAVRRVAVTILSALSTTVIARRLSVEDFGTYSGALASFYLLSAFCDLGFSTVLAREMASRPRERYSLLHNTKILATAWSAVVGVAMVVLAVVAGPHTERGLTMLALSPALAASGLAVARTVFVVDYDVGTMARVDVTTNVAQSVALIVAAYLRAPSWVLGVCVAASVLANVLWMLALSRSRVPRGQVSPGARREILVLAAPIGITSVMASAYFMLDLTIDAYLVTSTELAPYAAAVKVLGVVLTLPGLIMSAALPALSVHSGNQAGTAELVKRLWHWMAVTILPVIVASAVFAPTVLQLLFGDQYTEATTMLRILLASAVVAVLSNVLGNVLVARRRAWAMLAQNAVAVVVNVVGNIVLVPRAGVVASAWLTLGTEMLVCGCSMWLLRHSSIFKPITVTTVRPGLGLAAIFATGLLPMPAVAIPVAAVAFVALVTVCRAWPSEFPVVGRFASY